MDSKQRKSNKLLQGLKKGDEKAVQSVYDQAFHYCASFVLKNNGNMEDARSNFQECLIILFRNINRKDFSLKSSLKTYLYGINKNLWLKQLEKHKKTGLHLIVDKPEGGINLDQVTDEAIGIHQKEERLSQLEKALREHSEDCRKLLRLFFYEALNYREVAKAMGYTDAYVRKKKMLCIGALRKKLAIN